MTEKPDDVGNNGIETYLKTWGREVSKGQRSTPTPPGRQPGAQPIMDAVDAARDASMDRGQADARLLRLATEAEATGYWPWEGVTEQLDETEKPDVKGDRSGWIAPWLLALAACLPLAIGVGIWRMGSSSSTLDWEGTLNMRVWYNDFGSADRGQGALKAGTRPNIYISVPEAAEASLLVLDDQLDLSCDEARVAMAPPRCVVPWQLPDEPGTETLFVVLSTKPWKKAQRVTAALAGRLTGSREARVEKIVETLHRLGFAVAHQTYSVE